ncbi:MAG: hypothetical protein A2566_00480 [Candidatus Zambryskibacteria bacterium RIFOXYD1_FULL_40_13]|nr:MAG: hypothetical protein A2123_00550 [Candidatus Zambryskibacteria bacterium GWB1_40_5]OHB16028.1 MAG: hypothetical protein A2566_00480 [Candidatus Zambryskibacteria bacterium RIFOXYD1_FULL_40_13]HBD24992.1 hypothetical protein [Candidatus Zambryskibacteria bacterium]HBO17865.1 hypothetical protein [Candidatus Zambryskibacteria bacterium]HBZ04564.1 hypothetical protein [Candidatus Zambryskibacteria bacterium]
MEDAVATILVVDDERSIADVTASMLRMRGYTVYTAESRQEILDILMEHALELLITDVVMPQIGGVEVARLCQAMKPGLRCLFMSGYQTQLVNKKQELLGGVHFIQKPFRLADLWLAVDKVLESEPVQF